MDQLYLFIEVCNIYKKVGLQFPRI